MTSFYTHVALNVLTLQKPWYVNFILAKLKKINKIDNSIIYNVCTYNSLHLPYDV